MSENNNNLFNEHMLDEVISDDTVVDIEINDSISSTTSSEQCAICLDTRLNAFMLFQRPW